MCVCSIYRHKQIYAGLPAPSLQRSQLFLACFGEFSLKVVKSRRFEKTKRSGHPCIQC